LASFDEITNIDVSLSCAAAHYSQVVKCFQYATNSEVSFDSVAFFVLAFFSTYAFLTKFLAFPRLPFMSEPVFSMVGGIIAKAHRIDGEYSSNSLFWC
jgi:hypothetical protein